jgi:hypothetical protein
MAVADGLPVARRAPWTGVAPGPIVGRIDLLPSYGPDVDPIVAYVALPIVVLSLLLAIAYWRARARASAPARAVRWAVGATGLAFVAWVPSAIHAIVMSESSTAILAIVAVGPIGLAVAALVFVVTWALAIVGQSVWAPFRRPSLDGWTASLAWLIVVLAGAAGTTLGDRAHLNGVASDAASPSTLRELSHRLWRPTTAPFARHW